MTIITKDRLNEIFGANSSGNDSGIPCADAIIQTIEHVLTCANYLHPRTRALSSVRKIEIDGLNVAITFCDGCETCLPPRTTKHMLYELNHLPMRRSVYDTIAAILKYTMALHPGFQKLLHMFKFNAVNKTLKFADGSETYITPQYLRYILQPAIQNDLCKACIRSYCDDEQNKSLQYGCRANNLLPALRDIEKIVINAPRTIIKFTDGSETRAICNENDIFNATVGVLIALTKKAVGNKNLHKLITLLEKENKPVQNSIWSDVKIVFKDEHNIAYVDAWLTEDPNEESETIAKIHPDARVEYLNIRAVTDPGAQTPIAYYLNHLSHAASQETEPAAQEERKT